MVSSIRAIKMQDIITDIAAGPFGSNLKVSCFVDQGVPIIDGANLKGIKVTDNVTKFVTYEKAESLYRSIAIRGDIVVTISGNVGQIAYIPYDSLYERYLVSQRQFRLTINSLEAYVPYIVYYFHTPEGQHKILSFVNQTGVPALAQPLKNFKNIEIDLPDLETQKRIAKVLSALDDKIELNNQINKNLEEQAQALYQQMFETVSYSSRRICKADECFDISIGKTPPRKEPEWFSFNPTDVNWVSISDMGNCGLYISSSSERLTLDAVKQHNIKMVPDNTVLLSFKLTVGRVAITNGEMTTNEAIAHFKTENKDIVEYLYFYLKGFNFQTMGSTSSIAVAVNSKMIKAMPFVMPDTEKLLQFHSVVGPMFAEIKANQVASNKLKELRDSLLPKLMSGEIDVDNVEI